MSVQVGLIAVLRMSAASRNSSASTSHPAKARNTTRGCTDAPPWTNVVTADQMACTAPITITTTAASSLHVATTAEMPLTISTKNLAARCTAEFNGNLSKWLLIRVRETGCHYYSRSNKKGTDVAAR